MASLNEMSLNVPPPVQQRSVELGVTLLAMAEHFRTMSPPRYRMAIKCARVRSLNELRGAKFSKQSF